MEDCSAMVKYLEPLLLNAVLAKELFGNEYNLFNKCMNKQKKELIEYCVLIKYFHSIYVGMNEQKWVIHPDIIYVDKECQHIFSYSFESIGTNVFQIGLCTKCKLKFMRFVGRNKKIFSLRVKQLTENKPAWDKNKVIQKSTDVDKY